MHLMSRYPAAEWVPWKYGSPQGATYYRGQNQPVAAVLHVMQGWASTARQWALSGHYGASWHFTVGRDGSVMQHLAFEDGGYHAGITDTQAGQHPPTWPLWKGPGINVNHYTIGIEHEGFSGEPFTVPQAEASRKLCHWLGVELGIPVDEAHFPPHAAIDLINRPNDFNTPALRADFYAYLMEDDMALADDFKQLNEFLVKRERIRELASGTGDTGDARMLAAYDALRAAGLVP